MPSWALPALKAAAMQRDAGDLPMAIAALRGILAREPGLAPVEASLGLLLARTGDHSAAIEAFRRSLALDPTDPRAAFNLGSLLLDRLALEEAIEMLARAGRLRPGSAETWARLGTALFRQGRLDEAEASYRRALALRPTDHLTHSNLLYLMLHRPAALDHVLDEAREWGRRHATVDPSTIAPHRNPRDPDRPLRIGYVSPDFRRHALTAFIEPALALHDRAQVEVFAYADVPRPDATTERLKRHCDHWRPIHGIDEAAVAAAIRADGIDILVDLAGHTAGNRLRVFGHRPAPVQATWLGGGGTTGVPAIDYMIGDGLHIVPGYQLRCCEALVDLPLYWSASDLRAGDAGPADPPVLRNDHVTFASFNRLEKTHDGVIDAWCRVLRAVPGSRFILKTFAMRDAGTRARITAAFAARGIAAPRLSLDPPSAGAAYAASYGAADIMLDTFPYSGSTISRDALESGVPVIALPNAMRTGMMTLRRLKKAGLESLAAADVDDYVRLAVSLAQDRDRLVALRRSLPSALRTEGEVRAQDSVRNLETAYRTMWRRWCAGVAPVPFAVPS